MQYVLLKTIYLTRALSSIKPSACCMALLMHTEMGVKSWGGTIRAGDKANVIHVCTCIAASVVQDSMVHNNSNPGVLYQTLHCGASIKSHSSL